MSGALGALGALGAYLHRRYPALRGGPRGRFSYILIGFPYILKICNTLPILQNMQHIAHDAKHAIHFILCKICNIFYADAIDLKGGAAFGRPPLGVNKICIKYIAYFANVQYIACFA